MFRRRDRDSRDNAGEVLDTDPDAEDVPETEDEAAGPADEPEDMDGFEDADGVNPRRTIGTRGFACLDGIDEGAQLGHGLACIGGSFRGGVRVARQELFKGSQRLDGPAEIAISLADVEHQLGRWVGGIG